MVKKLKKLTKNNKKKVPRNTKKKHVGGMKLTREMFYNGPDGDSDFKTAIETQERINKNEYPDVDKKNLDIYKFNNFIKNKMIPGTTKYQQIAQNISVIANNKKYSSSYLTNKDKYTAAKNEYEKKGRRDLDQIMAEYRANNNGEEPDLNTKSIIADGYRKLYEKHIENSNSDDFEKEFEKFKKIATNKTNMETLTRATDTEIIAELKAEAAQKKAQDIANMKAQEEKEKAIRLQENIEENKANNERQRVARQTLEIEAERQREAQIRAEIEAELEEEERKADMEDMYSFNAEQQSTAAEEQQQQQQQEERVEKRLAEEQQQEQERLAAEQQQEQERMEEAEPPLEQIPHYLNRQQELAAEEAAVPNSRAAAEASQQIADATRISHENIKASEPLFNSTSNANKSYTSGGSRRKYKKSSLRRTQRHHTSSTRKHRKQSKNKRKSRHLRK